MRIVISLIILSWSLMAHAVATLKNVQVAPNGTRVEFDLNQQARYKVYTLENPQRVVIDFTDTILTFNLAKLNYTNTPIKKIRAGVHANNMLRIVLDMLQPATVNANLLQKTAKSNPRLIVNLHYANATKITQKTEPIKKDFIVVIDPGHGGDDPGAIGPKGTKEKDVALAVAKYLCALINKQQGMRAYLLRDGDYYLGLRERMRRARNKHADLMLSIHADGFSNKHAEGASVYVLSSKKASSESARWLALSENRADLVHGLSIDSKDDHLASVLLDLSQTASVKASVVAANSILKALGNTTKLHKDTLERAGFMVLRAPDVPSVLIETGFISNPRTEAKLRDKKYQQKLAAAIMQGVKEYYKTHQTLNH